MSARSCHWHLHGCVVCRSRAVLVDIAIAVAIGVLIAAVSFAVLVLAHK